MKTPNGRGGAGLAAWCERHGGVPVPDPEGVKVGVVKLGAHQFLDVGGLLLPIAGIRSIDLVSDPDETRVVMADDSDTTAFGGEANAALRAYIYRSV